MTYRVHVRVMPRAGLLDPQGQAVEHALSALGFAEAAGVRVGRAIELQVAAPSRADAEARARQMCEWYSLMNFTGDDSLEDVLAKLQDAAGREAKQRSPEEMRDALNDVLRATTVQSRKLLDEDRLSALEL